MLNKCIKLISINGTHNEKIKICSILNMEVSTKIWGDCTSHSKGYCNCLKNTSNMLNSENYKLVKYDNSKLHELIIGSKGASVKFNLKMDIFHNAINGKTFTVIDEIGELEEMVKCAGLKAIKEPLGNGSIKYVFNSPE